MASDILDNLSAHLVAQGIARQPGTAGPGHPLWIEPRDSVPFPGQRQGDVSDDAVAVLGIYRAPGIPAPRMESFLQGERVDVWYRVKRGMDADPLYRAVFAAVCDRFNWTMGAMNVLESQEWTALQPLDRTPLGFTYTSGLVFWRRRAA